MRFFKFSLFFFPDFMFENLELTCHLTSFHDKFIVAPSGWKPLNNASVCRESTQILQNCETSSRSTQAPLTLKVNALLISMYNFDTNICGNKIAIYSVRFDVKSTWFDSLLCHFVLFHSTAFPRWWDAFLDRQTNLLPKIRCSRNGPLDNDDTEIRSLLLTLHKRNQQIWHRSRTPIFLFSLSAVNRKSARIYCAQCRLFMVS